MSKPRAFRRLIALPLIVALLVAAGLSSANAGEPNGKTGPDARAYETTVAKAIAFLKSKGQAEDGSFSSHAGPGVTALVTASLLRHGLSPDDPFVARSLKHLESMVQQSGGIHAPGSSYLNYETCLAVMCFSEANKDGRYANVLKGADKFLKQAQWDDEEGHSADSPFHGGSGYGSKRRPDMSNTAFFVEALRRCGSPENDSAIQKAMIFISRCQNLETAHNTTPHAAKINDGGFYYTCAAGGETKAEQTENGGLRSYGSMTYAGLKSMIYAGIGPDDPRVHSARRWIQKHYDVTTNPGLGDAGLFYYYHTFAKTLDALGESEVEDVTGARHDWRSDLVHELRRRQQADGSWVNAEPRWLEGDPNLVTGYALLALSYCRPQPSTQAADESDK